MSKILDWSKVATLDFDDRRRKKLGIMTGRQAFQKSYEREAKREAHLEYRKQVEPLLKSELLQALVNRKPIQVLGPIQNPTETIGGLTKEEETDGFYQQVSKSSTNIGSFQEVMETIPAGTELIYKSWDKQIGQWIFNASNGNEYAIYDQPLIMFQGKQIENPGFYGLLYNTNITKVLEE